MANTDLGRGNFDMMRIPLCSTHNVPDYSHLAVDIDGAEGNIDPPSAYQRRRFGGTNLQTQVRMTSPCSEAKPSIDRLRREAYAAPRKAANFNASTGDGYVSLNDTCFGHLTVGPETMARLSGEGAGGEAEKSGGSSYCRWAQTSCT